MNSGRHLFSISKTWMAKRVAVGLMLALLLLAGLPVQASFPFSEGQSSIFPWIQVNSDGFGNQKNENTYVLTVFQNQLYAGVSNPDSGAKLWRSPQGQSWSQLSPGWQSDSNNTYLLDAISLWDENLILGTFNSATGGEIWTYDGYSSWAQINSDGFGDPNNIGVYSLIHSQLGYKYFAGTYNMVTGTEVYYYQSSSWSQINTDGFGDPGNTVATSMLVLEDYDLLVGTFNQNTGGEVWRWDGSTWNQVNSNGFGSTNNLAALSIGVFNDQQYVGTYNMASGTQIWRYNEVNHSWTNVMSGGFGDPHNVGIYHLYPFGGYLYAGTENSFGAQVWRTNNGLDWEPVMTGGFEDANNMAILSQVGFGHRLYVATNNTTTGSEIWRSEPMGPDPSFQISSVPVDAIHPEGAFNPDDNQFMVVWKNYNPGSEDISGQLLGAHGQLINPAFFVSTGSGAQRREPFITFDLDLKRFLVVWQHYESGTVSLRSQLISTTGGKIGGVNILKSVNTSDWALIPHQLVYSPVTDDYILLYSIHDDTYIDNGVNVMTLNPDGQLAVDDIVVRPLVSNLFIFHASLAWNHAHNECLVVWSEWDSDNMNVFGRLLELATPNVLGSAFLISTNREAFHDDDPSVAAMGSQPSGTGTYLVSWTSFDKTAPTYDMNYAIYARKVDGNGSMIGPTFELSVQPERQSCSWTAANEPMSLFFTGYITDFDDYSDFPFLHGRFLPEFAEAVSSELWLGMNTAGSGCAVPVSGEDGDFLVLSSSLSPGDSFSQVRGTLVSYRLKVYLPVIRR